MDDGQLPPGSGDAKSTAARRSRTRLRDVETVAATRLDMFGDNSLKEALAGTPPDLDEGETPTGALEDLPADEPPASDAADEPPPDPQHLDADAESEPAGDDLDGTASHGPPPDAPFGSPDEDQLAEHEPDATGTVIPMREVSSIFDALDAAEKEAGEQAQDPPASEPDSPGPDQAWEPEPAAEAMTARMEVSSIFDALDEVERHAEPEQQDSPDSAESTEANDEEAADASEPAPHDGLELNGWRSAPADLISKARQEGDALAQDVSGDAEPAEAAEQDREELPAPEPSQTPSDQTDPSPPASSPELSVGPPFPDLSGGGAPPAELAHPPPFFRSELEPHPTPSAADDPAAKIAAEANATAEVLENLQRMLDEKVPGVLPAPPPPEPDWPRERVVSSPPLVGGFRIGPQPAPPPHYGGGLMAPLMSLPVPPQRGSRTGVYVLGFLAGLGLSLMAGLVLYFFINMV